MVDEEKGLHSKCDSPELRVIWLLRRELCLRYYRRLPSVVLAPKLRRFTSQSYRVATDVSDLYCSVVIQTDTILAIVCLA